MTLLLFMRRGGFLLAVAAFVVISSLTRLADAQPTSPAPSPPPPLGESLTGDARTSYDIARILYRDGDYAGALSKFRRAYESSHDARLLWNMAACEKNLRRYRRVLELVDRYLAEGGDALTADDREQAKRFQAAVKTLVAEVRIEVNEAGADVLVDDDSVGVSPVTEPVVVDMGQHRFRAKKSGFVEGVVTREVEGGGAVTIKIELVREVHEARLVIVAAPGDVIAMDGRRLGEGRLDTSVPAGPHVIEVTAPGKRRRSIEIVLRDGERRDIPVDLERESATRWPWFVAGGAVLVGLVVGGYFLFRPKEPEPTPGTAGAFVLP